LWNVGTQAQIGRPLNHSGAVFAVVFSPDGKTLATGSADNKAWLWKL
jgi:WD40 repeat protein